MKTQNLKLMEIYRTIEKFSQSRRHRRYDIGELGDELLRLDLIDIQDMVSDKVRKLVRGYNALKVKSGDIQKTIFTFTITDEDGERRQFRSAANQMSSEEAGICMDDNISRVKQDIEAIQRAHDLFRRIHGPSYRYFNQQFLNGFAPWDEPEAG